jgi:L-alanine-DL-glutamate epimerase-like enolase superfamily enzyme
LARLTTSPWPRITKAAIGTAAAPHLAASLPNFFIQHIPIPSAEADRRMRAELTGGPVETVKDGFAPLPTAPGLGIAVHEEALEKYKERA